MKEKIFSIWRFIKEVRIIGMKIMSQDLAQHCHFILFFQLPRANNLNAVIGFFYNPNKASGEYFYRLEKWLARRRHINSKCV